MKLRISLSLFLCSTALAGDALRADAQVTNVLARHPELGFYEAEFAAAKAAHSVAGAHSDPELSVELGRKRVRDTTGATAGEGTAWSVSLAQTFDRPGRIALRKAIPNRDVALAELGLARFKTTCLEAVESPLDTKKEALEAAQQLELLSGLATPFVQHRI